MPELPDIELYVGALESRIVGAKLENVRVANPFLLRSVDPPLSAVFGKSARAVRRLGKRIVIYLDEDLFLVLHLMVAGRLRWQESGAKIPKKFGLAAFEFSSGVLILTEAGTTRRASLHVVKGEEALQQHDRGGLEVLETTLEEFSVRLRMRNHTLKRALCDPSLFSGIGNAYSDEILHAAKLSPFKKTENLSDEQISALFEAIQSTIGLWAKRLREEIGTGFPKKVTAFRPDMAVHGKFGKPCPICNTTVQRIRYASNETNYCPRCQTEGRLLKDRSLSRLLKSDWPQSIDELDN